MNNQNLNILYVLSEDDYDDLFYELCATRISGKNFYTVESRRFRKHGGLSEVRRMMRPLLNQLKGVSGLNAFFIIALDNDRAPDHQNNHSRLDNLSNRDGGKQCRYCEIQRLISSEWGANVANWPAKGAIAVPIEMLESWLLLGVDPNCGQLPIFSKMKAKSAQTYYSGAPPKQLKDLFSDGLSNSDISHKDEYILHVADTLDIDSVAARSASFENFRQQVLAW